MKPKRIILVRHGESEGNADEAIYGHKPDYALLLTPTGHAQAAAAGADIKKIIGQESLMVYLSPFFRTRETFESLAPAIAPNIKKWREEPRIREQEWGHLRAPEERDEVIRQRDAYGTFYFRIPDGESCADVYDRVTTFLDTMHRDFQKNDFPENVLLVTHGMTIRLFLMRWFQWSVEDFERLSNPKNCQIFTMELSPTGKYILKNSPPTKSPPHMNQRPLNLQLP